MKDATFLTELDRYILEERIEEEKTYLTILKHLRQKPSNRNADSAIKQIKKTPHFLGFGEFFSFLGLCLVVITVKKNYGHNHMVYFEIPVSYRIDPLIIASWGYCMVSIQSRR